MVILITGGAGFIGRWTVKKFLSEGNKVVVIDNLSNGRESNLDEFRNNKNFIKFYLGDIKEKKIVKRIFRKYKFEHCVHLAAQINVQESLDYPEKAFKNNIIGTYNILQEALNHKTNIILIGTCMVYDLTNKTKAISENHELKPSSPYAGSKLAAENLALSYYHGFGLSVKILRPFNTYGPFQKTNMEGGVVSIFVNRKLNNKKLKIFGDGTQTRDFLYVEDCANFIYAAFKSKKANGEVINAGRGTDISINDLAKLIVQDKDRIIHVKHHHPQAEIMKLVCDNTKAKKILKWSPKITLKEGIKKLENWIKENRKK